MYRFQTKPNKYGAKKTEYNGRTYHSKAEADYARRLDLEVAAAEIISWSPQRPVKMVVNGVLICKYLIDFEVLHNDGSIEWIEVKGAETAVYKLKAKLLKALYPTAKYTVVRA